MPKQVVFEPFEKQQEFIDAVLSNEYKYLMYGGAIRGGKVIPRDGVVLTPFGYKSCEDLKVGDAINNPDGSIAKIIQIHPWRTCEKWTVKFHDGTETVTSPDHLWLAWRSGKIVKRAGKHLSGEESAQVVETRTLLEWLEAAKEQRRRGRRQPNAPMIPVCHEQHFNISERTDPNIDPYFFGLWLGDGHHANGSVIITSADHKHMESVLDGYEYACKDISYRIKGTKREAFAKALKRFRLDKAKSGDKFIPRLLKMGSIETRWAVLNGLMDSDGTVTEDGKIRYTSISKQLAEDVQFVIQSLGGTATIKSRYTHYKNAEGNKQRGQKSYRLYIKHREPWRLFRLERKKKRCIQVPISMHRRIVDIEIDGTFEGRCIQVSHPNGLYLTNDFIVTHNTYVALALVFVLCKIYPGSRWAIVRKDLPAIRRNVIPTFDKLKPDSFVGDVSKSEWTAKCANGSEIIFFPESLKEDPEYNRWRGLEVNGFILEEANELAEKTFLKAIERVGTWSLPDSNEVPHPVIILTCNPARNWVKRVFHDPWRDGQLEKPFFYQPARADDNPYIPEVVKEGWLNLPDAEYNRFVLGDWDAADEPDQLIKAEWCWNEGEHVAGAPTLGIDVARFGDDNTIMVRMNGNSVVAVDEVDDSRIDQTAELVAKSMLHYGIAPDRVVIDAVGLGAGVADILKSSGKSIRETVGGAAPLGVISTGVANFHFANLRSQMYWYAREFIREGKHHFAKSIDPGVRQKIIDDLCAPKYKINNDKVIFIEPKQTLKKRIGRSPDYGDAYVLALFCDELAKVDDFNIIFV